MVGWIEGLIMWGLVHDLNLELDYEQRNWDMKLQIMQFDQKF